MQVLADIVLVVQERLKCELTRVVKLRSSNMPEKVVRIVLISTQLFGFAENSAFRLLQNAVEPTEHAQRQEHLAVLVPLVVVPKDFLPGPDERKRLPPVLNHRTFSFSFGRG